ncbi:octanoyl-[GcvH]:protein N-octanoyltransferase/lipoyl amidotransferase [Lentibacillus persicus]|uniref:Octanoyl-[GcvH]:protein N-octanoyltransferase n=1 Tax=Lentibacillus persicus TaxID=640948 RepID=A0A1I1XMD1_9BACI|nr:lipoate--protein ligase family protein [Lentibacillus persicus]SFE08525.1 octanoyl-[GcvH]:protein N-octanoyltransferase/lipoyl amidotransferase [Lentibacillus persicus]
MKNWRDMVAYKRFRWLDHTGKKYFHGKSYTALTSFAVDDVLSLFVRGGEATPAIRLWTHPETVVLGIPDSRLPYLKEGVRMLSENGYYTIVRNSGGLAVALDDGVLNMSLVLPDMKRISIYDCYEAMVSFVRFVLRDLTDDIEAYEIVGSYCPGDYDLSIRGRKFAGISQRRVRDGAAIQIYLDVEGKGRERAELIRDFYEVAKKDAETKFTYPVVNPAVMASLSELLGMDLTVSDMKKRVQNALEHLTDEIVTEDFSIGELEQFEKRYNQMVKRNEEIAEMQ